MTREQLTKDQARDTPGEGEESSIREVESYTGGKGLRESYTGGGNIAS